MPTNGTLWREIARSIERKIEIKELRAGVLGIIRIQRHGGGSLHRFEWSVSVYFPAPARIISMSIIIAPTH